MEIVTDIKRRIKQFEQLDNNEVLTIFMNSIAEFNIQGTGDIELTPFQAFIEIPLYNNEYIYNYKLELSAPIEAENVLLNQLDKFVVIQVDDKIVIGEKNISVIPQFDGAYIEQTPIDFNIILDIKDEQPNVVYQKPLFKIFINNQFVYQGYKKEFEWKEFNCKQGDTIFAQIQILQGMKKINYKTKTYIINNIQVENNQKRYENIEELSGDEDNDVYYLRDSDSENKDQNEMQKQGRRSVSAGYPIYFIPQYNFNTFIPTPNNSVQLQFICSQNINKQNLQFDILGQEKTQFCNLNQIIKVADSQVYQNKSEQKLNIVINESDEGKLLFLRVTGYDLDGYQGYQIIQLFSYQVSGYIKQEAEQLCEWQENGQQELIQQQNQDQIDQELDQQINKEDVQQNQQLSYSQNHQYPFTFNLYQVENISQHPITIKLYKNCWFYNDQQYEYKNLYISKFQPIIDNQIIDCLELVNYLAQKQVEEQSPYQMNLILQQQYDKVNNMFIILIEQQHFICYSEDQIKTNELIGLMRIFTGSSDQQQQIQQPQYYLNNKYEAQFKHFNTFYEYIAIQRDIHSMPKHIIPKNQYQLPENSILIVYSQKTQKIFKVFTSGDQTFQIPLLFDDLKYRMFDLYGDAGEGQIEHAECQIDIYQQKGPLQWIDFVTQNQIIIDTKDSSLRVKDIQQKTYHLYQMYNSELQVDQTGRKLILKTEIYQDEISLDEQQLLFIAEMFGGL